MYLFTASTITLKSLRNIMNAKESKPCSWRSTFGVEPPVTKYSLSQKFVSEEDVCLVKEGIKLSEYDERHKWGLYCVCDGHGGVEAAELVKARLWEILEVTLPHEVPTNPARYENWTKSIRIALRDAFATIEVEFRTRFEESLAGSTLTVALVCGWLLTVANLGDSEACLDTGDEVIVMTHSHRLEECEEEQERMKEAGVTLARLCSDLTGPAAAGKRGRGPQRCWPGGLANARAVGDISGGDHVLVAPYIKQCVMPHRGCRLIIGSDGVWDTFDHKMASNLTRNCPNATAASRLVTSVLYHNQWMVGDDTTALVVDFLPKAFQEFSEMYHSISRPQKKSIIRSLFACFFTRMALEEEVEDERNSLLASRDVLLVSEIDCAQESEDDESTTILASIDALGDSASEVYTPRSIIA